MSTKTTFKRVALVAVAALGFGMLSVVPSNAAVVADVFTTVGGASTASSTGSPNVAVTGDLVISGIASLPADKLTLGSTVVSSPLTSSNTTVSYASTVGGGTDVNSSFTGNKDCNASAAGRFTCYVTVSFTPDVAGTYSIKLTSGTAVNDQSITWTITVASSALDAAASTAVLGNATAAATLTPAAGTKTTVTAPKAAGTPFANVSLAIVRANTQAYTGTEFTARLVGNGGLISAANGACANAPAATLGVAKTATINLGANGLACISISGDNIAGTATLEILAGTTVWKSFTVVSSGSATAYAVDSTNPATVVSLLGVGKTQSWDLRTVDAAGNTVNSTPAIFAVSSDETVLTVAVVGDVVTATGVKGGTGSFTVCNTAKCVDAAIKLGPVTVNVSDVFATSVPTFSTDKDDYAVGEAFTLTIAAKDANGLGLADGTYTNMASISTNVQVVAGQTAGVPVVFTGAASNVTFTGGKATFTGFMPASTGAVTFKLTLNATGGGTTGVATAAAGAVFTKTVNVSSAAVDTAQAATDAAAEATDAANAATDAANAAAEAADAATAAAQDAADAVAALSTQVAEMIDALKKQITALTNLVIKIQKKVKA